MLFTFTFAMTIEVDESRGAGCISVLLAVAVSALEDFHETHVTIADHHDAKDSF